MTSEQIEMLYMFIMFNGDLVSPEQLAIILETNLSKDPINN
tara:strand:- start:1339 stop:1461 length:123 start_codon:yes stop_codon:yes gene_type:complete